jgi:CheY-like chemotaxis protein
MNQVAASTIMIVGDDADFSYLMQRYVRQSGHRMLIAGPGEQVVALARQNKPAAIVLEADRPETTIWNVLRTLKADQLTCDIPVVICSWRDEEARSLAEGADGYLRKPVMYEDFLVTLAEAGIDSGTD